MFIFNHKKNGRPKWGNLFLLIMSLASFSLPTFSEHANSSLEKSEGKKGQAGFYVELGGRSDPNAIGGEIGFTGFMVNNLSLRAGLSFVAAEHIRDFFGGFSLGMRAGLKSNFSPFLGMGVFGGFSESTIDVSNDGIDNDNDSFIDELGEESEIIDNVLASIYPEIGINLRITRTAMLTLSLKYHITSDGRQSDF